MIFLITGGYGFIGSALIRYILKNTSHKVINIDCLTYAANLESLELYQENSNYLFYNENIINEDKIQSIINHHQPDYVMHLAAESHVDKSIENPSIFIQTNIIGTHILLKCCLKYWRQLTERKKSIFRFHHVSTDEVFGDLALDKDPFDELSPYNPSSPYSASKASSDHLVRAWERTYNLPTIITNCSNNYGPYQNAEKLIPTVIINALKGYRIPVYGDGKQIRDWLFVEDHAIALYKIITSSVRNITYNIGGGDELTNLQIINLILNILEEFNIKKSKDLKKFEDLILFVKDRPGHDKRYAINSEKLNKELSWSPQFSIIKGLEKTIKWYLNNK